LAERILTGKFLRLRLKESFDRFNSKFTRRRKEMVNFRRVVTVFAVLALFTGLAFAQQENCSAQATNSTPLRGEGFTEQTGDIIINCVSGVPLAPGANIPLVNITVFYNTTVTSRLLPTSAPQASNQTSEALLLIDEPTTNFGATPTSTATTPISYGSTLPMIPCLSPLTGCTQTVGANNAGYATAVVGASAAPNVYQGVVNGNSVTFYGVPVLPPSTVGSRVYRITNVRVNANQVSGGSASGGTTPVQSFITVSGSAALPISNSQPIVGYIQNGLTVSIGGAKTYQQCNSQTKVAAGVAKFTENFGSAFKTRVFAQTNTNWAGQAGVLPQAPTALNQDTPGGIYNSESNFVYSAAFGANNYTVGLSDFGTRLKATFNNVPSGVHVFVQTQNTGANAAALANPGGNLGNANIVSGYTGLAYLVSGETLSDGAGILPSVTATDNAASLGIAEVSISAGTGTAVWEVVNTNPNTIETFSFPIYITYTAATATNTPLPGTSTVTLSFAPTATSGAASSSLPIPRFSSGNSATGNIFTINVCRTILLYPYITNQGGFDTGLTVANTSQDPVFGTGAQNGACTFTYYGGTTAAPTTPPAPSNTGNIAAGTVWANTLGAVAPTFQGYAFAVCNFQFAHGFAFISDIGARNLAMGYLALIIPDAGGRDPSPFANGTGTGEQEAH
jgi:hypothetical protein